MSAFTSKRHSSKRGIPKSNDGLLIQLELDQEGAALIGDSVETMRNHYQGHCKNRWRREDDVEQLNALNRIRRHKLEIVKG